MAAVGGRDGEDAAGELSDALRERIEEEMGKKRADLNGIFSIGDVGAVFVAQKLRGNTIVERLELQHCEFGVVGVRALAESLGEHNVTLKVLLLGGNMSMGDAGAWLIGEMLKKNTTLERLSLYSCGIGPGGDGGLWATALASALRESNSTLTRLDQEHMVITDPFMIGESIRALLKENEAVRAQAAEQRARCLLFCCLKLAPSAHEHVVPSIGAVPVPVMQYAVEHAGELHVAERFEVGNAVAGLSSAGVRGRPG